MICQSTKQFSDIHLIKQGFVFPNRGHKMISAIILTSASMSRFCHTVVINKVLA